MLVLVTYDVSVKTRSGQKRLRIIAKICLNYGLRVQNSVFECEVDPAQMVVFQKELLDTYDPNEDSLRFYYLGSKGRKKIEHFGAKVAPDILKDTLLI
jgi:CRISPR-associated protein Cas2